MNRYTYLILDDTIIVLDGKTPIATVYNHDDACNIVAALNAMNVYNTQMTTPFDRD